MSTTRKLQWNRCLDLYFCTIPKVLVEAIGLKKGDKLQYSIKDNSIIITPEAAILPGLPTSEGCADPIKEVVQHG